MRIGNKIDKEEVKTYEITIAKCGLLSLMCEVDPKNEIFFYKIKASSEKIFDTYALSTAIRKFNELVE